MKDFCAGLCFCCLLAAIDLVPAAYWHAIVILLAAALASGLCLELLDRMHYGSDE